MARINGVNSDYFFDESEQTIVGPEEDGPFTSPLEMKLFICPYNKPNTLQPLDGESSHCQGSNLTCPQPGSYNDGHAMIHLHEDNGIELNTGNNNRILIGQTGNITLDPASKAIVAGTLEVQKSDGTKVFLRINDSSIVIESNSGAKISLASNGDIELEPDTGRKVMINGNLEVSGTINGTNI